jgi:hypothetical protein
MQKNACIDADAAIDCAPQRRFGSLFLGRFLPKLGGAARCRHFFYGWRGNVSCGEVNSREPCIGFL